LTASNQPVGLLAIGPRRDQAILNARDVEIIEIIGQQAALFLLTAVQIEQLQQVPHQINRAQERERDRIAQELHDTIQQFLGRLPFFLEVSRESIYGSPEEADALLRRCLDDVEQAARTVRQIRHNLIPPEIAEDFNQAIARLSERFHRRHQIPVNLTITPYPEERLTPEARHALYRIIQQALHNIAAHAGAQQVAITLQQRNGRFQFSIVDDGVGFNDAQRKKAEAAGSFGLQSMTARLHAVGGDLAIHSQPAQGTRITGRLPI
jgi:signal transduction histidine kinase